MQINVLGFNQASFSPMRIDIMSSLINAYYRNFKSQSIVLKWLLNGLLDNLPYQSVLDIGGSI
jgi:hypothetical protein